MAHSYVVAVDGLSDTLNGLSGLTAEITRAAYQAINKTTERTRTASARAIREQVAFPAQYLSAQDGRLTIVKRAKADDLTAIIEGRDRPTSLARFVTSGTVGNRRGVRVQVNPGRAERSRRMFLIRLRAGTADLDTKSNLGLAIRLRPGESVHNKRTMVRLKGNLYLLYGPSVAQIFATVAEDQAPGAAEFLEREFLRLMELNG